MALARSGGLDGALLAQGRCYQTDDLKALLFIAGGPYLDRWPGDLPVLGNQ